MKTPNEKAEEITAKLMAASAAGNLDEYDLLVNANALEGHEEVDTAWHVYNAQPGGNDEDVAECREALKQLILRR